jgi:hypothetical protein
MPDSRAQAGCRFKPSSSPRVQRVRLPGWLPASVRANGHGDQPGGHRRDCREADPKSDTDTDAAAPARLPRARDADPGLRVPSREWHTVKILRDALASAANKAN